MSVRIPLPQKNARMVVLACMILYACVMCVNLSAPIILPRMLAEIGGMNYYAFASVVNSIGIMISAPVTGKIGDAFGRKWLTVGAVILHMTLLLLTSLSRSPLAFIIFYTLAGVGIGLYISMPHAILGDILPPEKRGKYFGFISASGAAGMLLGPLTCGLIVDSGYHRAAFYVAFPLMAAGIALLLLYYPNKATVAEKTRPDLPGLFLLVAAVGCSASYINFGGSALGYLSPPGLLLLSVGAVSFALFFRHVRRVSNPIVDIGLFSNRSFSVAWLIRFIFTAYLLCASSFLVLYAQNAMGVSATISSTLAMPQTICMILLSPLIGSAVSKDRRNFRRCYLTMGLCGMAALAIWASISPNASLIPLYIGMAIGGVAYAMEQTISTPYFQLSIRQDQYGAAQGMSFFASSAGGGIWGAVYGAILSGGDLVSQVRIIFLLGMCIMLGIVAIGFLFVKTTDSAQSGKESAYGH